MKNILITGATGFIGTALLNKLLDTGCTLHLLVRNLAKIQQEILSAQNVRLFSGDINDSNIICEAAKGVDTIIHLAGAANMFEKKGLLFATNVAGMQKILKALENLNRAIHIIFASSIEAAGPQPEARVFPVDEPVTEYGASKLKAEHILLQFCKEHPNIEFTIVRIGNVYTRNAGIISAIDSIARQGGWRARILKKELKDFSLHLIHLDDLINMFLKVIEIKEAKNKVYYFAHESLSIKQILEIMNVKEEAADHFKLFGKQFLHLWNYAMKVTKRGDIISYISFGKAGRPKRNYPTQQAIEELGYMPKIYLKDIY